MTPLRQARLITSEPGRVLLALDHGWRCQVVLAAGGIGRFSLLPPEGWREPRSWALDPGGQFPLTGTPRDGLYPPDATAQTDSGIDAIRLHNDLLQAHIRLQPFGITWSQRGPAGDWLTICSDRASYAYAFSARTGTLHHWQQRDAHDQYFGLGDKTGPLNKHGRRLRTRQLDALGYNGETSDPLYKHWPFFLGRRADTGAAYGLYTDTLAECTYDFGNEHDNYHGFYRATEVHDGDLDNFVFAGPDLRAALARFVAAIGGTAMPPRWSLGYANTAMALADHPDAQARIAGFLDRVKAERFPMSSFHFGSGYTSRGQQRYVFTWNTDKFPDPAGLLRGFADAGLRTVANLKPCLLDDHPAYAGLAAQGAFVREPGADGEASPCLDQFWDGWGAHLDFSRPLDRQWWQQQLQAQVLDVGFTAGWNDNNEYVIWGEQAQADGFGQALPLPRSRALQALLMTRATAEQQALSRPGERVYTITRAGPPGIQRYAQTWTGDNSTSWHTLRWNQRMALTMGLSGLFNTGHDIGGFFGPVPDAELLTRWTQACCLLPRMIMNSWKADGSVNSPWLHPEATADIRAAIGLRLQLMPYLYTQLWRATQDHAPVLRPTFFDFADDPQAWADNDEMMVGPDLLVAPVFEPGARQRRLYLPRGAHASGWFEWATGRWLAGGQTVTVDAPLNQLPLFVRGGALLPTTGAADDLGGVDEAARLLRYFPAPGQAGSSQGELFDDDGLRLDGGAAGWVHQRFTAEARADGLTLSVDPAGTVAGAGAGAGAGAVAGGLPSLPVQVPAGEQRSLQLLAPHLRHAT